MDQLNARSPASLDAAFPAAEAKRLVDTLEADYTPKHGTWPTMAELELSVPERQRLRRRLGDGRTPERQVTSWVARRTAAHTKLRRLHPASEG